MDEKNMAWGRAERGLTENWPLKADGEPEQAALLVTLSEGPAADMTANLLEAYGIPVYKKYQEDGTFARVMFGASAYGVGLYVPASRQEEAQGILEAVPGNSEESTPEDGAE